MTAGPHRSPAADLDRTVGRLLTVGTYVAVLLLAIGAVLMMKFAAEAAPDVLVRAARCVEIRPLPAFGTRPFAPEQPPRLPPARSAPPTFSESIT